MTTDTRRSRSDVPHLRLLWVLLPLVACAGTPEPAVEIAPTAWRGRYFDVVARGSAATIPESRLVAAWRAVQSWLQNHLGTHGRVMRRPRLILYTDRRDLEDVSAESDIDGWTEGDNIHVLWTDDGPACLRHELTHWLLAELLVGDSLPAWLEEGLATALETEPQPELEPRYEPEQLARLIGKTAEAMDADDYRCAGHVVRHLLALHPDALRRVVDAHADGLPITARGLRAIALDTQPPTR